MSLYLKDAVFVNWETLEFVSSHILVESGVNGKIHFTDNIPLKTRADQIIDCRGKIVTKSFVNAHNHSYLALMGSLPPPAIKPENFYERLKYGAWRLDKKLALDMIEACALYAAMKSLKSGVTFVFDHHSSPFAIEGSLETIAGAFEFVGVSHLLCYEISDRDGLQKGLEGFSQTEQYLRQVKGLVGLHASFTVSDHSMRRAASLVEKFDTGVHIHVAEDKYDQQHCRENYKKTVVERLNDFGFLESPKTVLAHCLQISESESSLLAKSNAWIVQTTESNLRNNLGCLKDDGLEEKIMLGTDGMHHDMIRSARCSFFAGNDQHCVDAAKICSRLRNANRYLMKNSIKGDGENNLIIINNDMPLHLDSLNFCDNLMYRFSSQNIQHVISKGELVVKNQNLVNMNEEDILGFIREMGVKLAKSFN